MDAATADDRLATSVVAAAATSAPRQGRPLHHLHIARTTAGDPHSDAAAHSPHRNRRNHHHHHHPIAAPAAASSSSHEPSDQAQPYVDAPRLRGSLITRFSEALDEWLNAAVVVTATVLTVCATIVWNIVQLLTTPDRARFEHLVQERYNTQRPLEPSKPLGQLDEAAKPVATTIIHEAISGTSFGWFREDEYHVPLEEGKTIMARRRAVRFTPKTHGALLLVHGFAQNRFAWHVEGRSVANYLAEAGYDVFFVDLRGTRESLKLGAPMPLSCSQYIEVDLCQAVRLVRIISGHDKLTLIGHSLGGALSCSLAAMMPEYIDGVVHIAGLYGFRHHAKWKKLLWFDRITRPLQDRLPLAITLPTRQIGLLLRFLRFVVHSPLGILLPIKPYLVGSIELSILSRYLFQSFESTSLGILRNITGLAHGLGFVDEKGDDYLVRFSKLHMPLFVICADRDDLVNINDSLECFHQSASHDKEQLVFISDASESANPAFGHCDILIGKLAVHLVWAPLRLWLDRHRTKHLVDTEAGSPDVVGAIGWAAQSPGRRLINEISIDERSTPARFIAQRRRHSLPS